MAKIPGKILILSGVAVILLSILFNFIKKTSRFNLFIIISVVIILWGIVSLYFEKKQEKEEQEENPQIEQKTTQKRHAHHTTSHTPHHTTHHNIITCHNCGLKHYSHANYCQRCGTKLNKISKTHTKDL